jgi:uncharacterized protein YunC (DUF1805 family)
MLTKLVKVGKNTAEGIEISLKNGNLVMVMAPKGFIVCGYLNMVTAEKLGDCAAIIKGIKNIEELLSAKVVEVSSKARKIGIKPGMKGLSALAKMF